MSAASNGTTEPEALTLTVAYSAEAEVVHGLTANNLHALAKALDEGASVSALIVRTKIDKVRTGP